MLFLITDEPATYPYFELTSEMNCSLNPVIDEARKTCVNIQVLFKTSTKAKSPNLRGSFEVFSWEPTMLTRNSSLAHKNTAEIQIWTEVENGAMIFFNYSTQSWYLRPLLFSSQSVIYQFHLPPHLCPFVHTHEIKSFPLMQCLCLNL